MERSSHQLNTYHLIYRLLYYIEALLLERMVNKSNHCLFEIPYLKSICALGGENSNEVEVFNLEEKTWKNLPELNCIREGAACCVVNDTFLYCFFGYDSENSEYLTSIETKDFSLEIDKYTNIDNTYMVDLNYNFKLPYIYSNKIINEVYNEGTINEDKLIIEYLLLVAECIRDAENR